jgi:hypothetical protein
MPYAPCSLRFLICFTLHSLRLTPYAKLGFNFHLTPHSSRLTVFNLDITAPVEYSVRHNKRERKDEVTWLGVGASGKRLS